MKYILFLLIGVTLVGCAPIERRDADPVLFRQVQSTVVETLVYKNHMVQRQTTTMDTPLHEVVVSPKTKEDVEQESAPETKPAPKRQFNADGSGPANKSSLQQ